MSNFSYQQHDSFTTPNDNTPVYHSIRLDYLKESIKNKQLRFASVSSYRDSFEGKFPYPNEFSIGKDLIFIDNQTTIFGNPQKVLELLATANITGNVSAKVYPIKYFLDEWSTYVFSHCWSLNSKIWSENYSNSTITIQSTVGSIKKAFSGDYHYHIGKVKYINYLTEALPSFQKLLTGQIPSTDLLYERHLHKRLKYKQEQEVRLIISWESFVQTHPEVEQILPRNPYDKKREPERLYSRDYLVYRKVDFSQLIEAILVRSNIAEKQLEDLKSTLVESGIDLSVIKRLSYK